MSKRELGQYYTEGNPFKNPLFMEWFGLLPNGCNLLEPFAGANYIVKSVKEVGITNSWSCFDIEPNENNVCSEYKVEKRDSINDFPKGFIATITNPPYLAKNSATRRKIAFPDTKYDDLYKVCVDLMLSHCPYVAAIIPESFITSGEFLARLYGVISITDKIFADTECPVCLALFTPKGTERGIKVYSNNTYLGTLEELQKCKVAGCIPNINWVFNDKNGNIGVKAVDSQKTADCKFFVGEKISPEDIKVSSRAFTRISGLPKEIDREEFIKRCNQALAEYRVTTNDILMTPFKGLRKDGKYRRRLDFKTIRYIMDYVLEEMGYTMTLF